MKRDENFIERAIKLHGNRYDYSKVEYKNAVTKVCIICPEHGEFWQAPTVHLKGCGCPECARLRKVLDAVFFEKAKKIHNNKYDYSKVEYKHSKKPVCIICPTHGEFWQAPADHLKGCGCPECAKNVISLKKTRTQNDFLERAVGVHGNKYDYSKVNYINSKSKVCIICPEHGEFWQTPSMHLCGNGCPKCDKSHKMDKTDFIEKAKKIHADKYDYSKVEYKSSQEKVCIICPEHGEFWQTPNTHLRGHGCQKCDMERKRQIKYNTDEIIKRFKIVHGDYFDYSKFEYNGITKKSTIICPIHGEFLQTAHEHIKGNGCPMCNQSSLEKEVRNSLKKNDIFFIEQKKFDWLVYKGKQSIDFYLPHYKIAIECQGTQHFKPIPFFTKSYESGEAGFKEIVNRDDNKRKLCEENGIKVLYFSHKNIFIENRSNIKEIFDNTNDLIKEVLKHE